VVLERLRAGCTAFFFAVCLVGCAARLQKPEIALAGVDLVGLGLVEQRFVLTLRVRNPNDVELPISALNFNLELNGRQFAKGASEKPVIVPRQGEAELEVATVSRLAAVLKPLSEARKDGRERIGYRLYGTVELERAGRFPFERSGELPLAFLGKLAPK